MAPRLVFVHGIGPARHVDTSREAWSDALVAGAALAGHPDLAAHLAPGGPVEIVFASYGDLFGTPQAQGSEQIALDEDEALALQAFLTEIIDTRLAAPDADQIHRVLRHSRAQLHPKSPQGAGDVLRRAINAATTLMSFPPLSQAGRWISGVGFAGAVAQVGRYLGRRDGLDERIRLRVHEALGDGPAVVVAHSLGSVVAWETLTSFRGEIPLFVTLGSPLATKALVWPRLAPRPPGTPGTVAEWVNFWDHDDIVVPRPELENLITANAAGVRPESRRVSTVQLWAHSATRYLSQAAVAGPVAEAVRALAAR